MSDSKSTFPYIRLSTLVAFVLHFWCVLMPDLFVTRQKNTALKCVYTMSVQLKLLSKPNNKIVCSLHLRLFCWLQYIALSIVYVLFFQKGTMFVWQFLAVRLKNVISLFKSTFETEASIANNCNRRHFLNAIYIGYRCRKPYTKLKCTLHKLILDCRFWFILNSNMDCCWIQCDSINLQFAYAEFRLPIQGAYSNRTKLPWRNYK